MNIASLKNCRELYKLSGWQTEEWFDADEFIFKPMSGTNPYKVAPAYNLGYLFDKAFERGHKSIRIKKVAGNYLITSSPAYHLTAKTPVDALAKMLICDFKRCSHVEIEYDDATDAHYCSNCGKPFTKDEVMSRG